MNREHLLDRLGFILTGIFFIFSLILFFNYTKAFIGSCVAALLAAALFWVSYVLIRLVVLAFRNK